MTTGGSLSAHRLDEYLQATRIAIDPDRVEIALDLTPGTAVAERVLAEIDRDADKVISAAEGQAYAQQVVNGIALAVDRTTLRLDLIDTDFPTVDAMLRGVGTMRLRAQASVAALEGGAHQLRYRNAHQPDLGVYLTNALIPANDRVTIASQRRDVDQRELTIDYTLRTDRATRLGTGVMGAIAITLVLLLFGRRRAAVTPR